LILNTLANLLSKVQEKLEQFIKSKINCSTIYHFQTFEFHKSVIFAP